MSVLSIILCSSACLLVFFYICSKLRVFEKLLANHYVFDPKELDKIVKKAVELYPNDYKTDRAVKSELKEGSDGTVVCQVHGKNWIREVPDMDGRFTETEHNPDGILELRCEYILKQLHEKYPKYCSDVSTMDFFDSRKMKSQWMFNMCGGAIGHMCIFHFSFTEYIIIYGTPISTSGFSGRYMMDVYDFILQGHHETFTPGNLRGLHYKPGDMTFLHRFEACTYKSSPHTYMMEYGRGFPGVLLGACYPIISALFTTLDFYSFYHQCKVVSGHIFKNWFQNGKF